MPQFISADVLFLYISFAIPRNFPVSFCQNRKFNGRQNNLGDVTGLFQNKFVMYSGWCGSLRETRVNTTRFTVQETINHADGAKHGRIQNPFSANGDGNEWLLTLAFLKTLGPTNSA